MSSLGKYETIQLDFDKFIATVRLNRPEVHNAFNNILINDLFDAFVQMQDDDSVRLIIVTGSGKSFCAGADLNWMKSVVNYTYEQNYQESLKLAELMHLIFTHSKPVIAKVNGSAIGGGVGLLSVCDIAIASDAAKFGLSEVRLGLVPAAISPYVMSRIGQKNARELFITGERIDAARALEIGLVNKVVPVSLLDDALAEVAGQILSNGPEAVKSAKQMIFNITQMQFPEITEYNARLIAGLRQSKEGQEGMNAFLEKRLPSWRL